MTGAKILVTGSVLQVGNSFYLVAKIIGTETSRVWGESAKGNVQDDLDNLAGKAALQEAAAQLAERLLPKLAGAQ